MLDTHPDRLLDTKQAAAFVGLSPWTFYDHSSDLRRGLPSRFPYLPKPKWVGRKPMYRLGDLVAIGGARDE